MANVEKRKRGTGTVSRSGERWQARLPNRLDRKSIGLFDTEEEAHRRLDNTLALHPLFQNGTVVRLTVAAHGTQWLEERTKTYADARQDQSRWRCHVVGSDLGNMALEDVRPIHVRRFYAELGSKVSERTGRPLSVSLIRSIKSVLRQCFRAALEAEIIEGSPAEGVSLPKLDLTNRAGDHDNSWTYLEPAEIKAVEKLLRAEKFWEAFAAFQVGLYAGLRPGEILGLCWRDVQVERKRLHVRRSYDGTTKTNETRYVPLLPPPIAALKRWQKMAPANPHDLVFPGATGGTYPKGFVWGWRDKGAHIGIPTRAGIRRHVTWYSATRHSCASHLLMGTWVRRGKGWMTRRLLLEDVSKWLGHANIAVTQRYAHLAENWLDRHLRV